MNSEIREIKTQIINILSDGCQHSWNSICQQFSQRPPVITTALIELLETKSINCQATTTNIFYSKLD